jgi:hypothetical protein
LNLLVQCVVFVDSLERFFVELPSAWVFTGGVFALTVEWAHGPNPCRGRCRVHVTRRLPDHGRAIHQRDHLCRGRRLCRSHLCRSDRVAGDGRDGTGRGIRA